MDGIVSGALSSINTNTNSNNDDDSSGSVWGSLFGSGGIGGALNGIANVVSSFKGGPSYSNPIITSGSNGSQNNLPQQPPAGKSKTWLIVGIVCAVLVLIVALIYLGGKNK